MNTSVYGKALKWPIVAWIVVDVILTIAFLIPGLAKGLGTIVSDQGLTPLLLAFGIWAGYKTVQLGGNFVDSAAVGIVVGAVCAALGLSLFGLILGYGINAVLPGAVYDFLMNVAGALIGGGFALTK